MPATREAKYLSGADLGKTVEGVDLFGKPFTCTATRIDQAETYVDVWSDISSAGFKDRHMLKPTEAVTITGKEA